MHCFPITGTTFQCVLFLFNPLFLCLSAMHRPAPCPLYVSEIIVFSASIRKCRPAFISGFRKAQRHCRSSWIRFVARITPATSPYSMRDLVGSGGHFGSLQLCLDSRARLCTVLGRFSRPLQPQKCRRGLYVSIGRINFARPRVFAEISGTVMAAAMRLATQRHFGPEAPPSPDKIGSFCYSQPISGV